MNDLKMVFDGSKQKNVNGKVLTLENDYHSQKSALYNMINDAIETKSKVFVIKKPLRSKGEIPRFVFL